MSISVHFLQSPQAFAPEVESHPVAPTPTQMPTPPIRPASRRSRRAKRTQFTQPARVVEQETDAVFRAIVPRQPRSLFQQQLYLSNMALVGQVVQQKGIAKGVVDLGKAGNGPGTGGPGTGGPGTGGPGTGGPGTGTPPGNIDFPDNPPLGDIGYAILARLIAIAAQLADTNKADVISHLAKIDIHTKLLIEPALALLDRLKMSNTANALKQGTDREPFAKLAGLPNPPVGEFQRLLHAACRHLVEAQFWCVVEAPDDDDVVAVATPASPAPVIAEAVPARAARRAARTSRTARKTAKPQRKR